MIVTEYIQKERFAQFHNILCATGGRYLRNPFILFLHIEVCYEPGDYKAQCEAWKRCTTPIREKNKNQLWRVILRRIGIKYF